MIFNKMRGIHINGRKDMSIQKPIQNYLNPSFVYIPLGVNNLKYEQLVAINDHVLMGQPVFNRTDRFAHPISSPVSGTVKGIKKMWHPCGKMIDTLEIENDFKEEKYEDFKPSEEELTKEVILERVKRAGIVGLGGAGFPTFAKHATKDTIDTVIINAAECEPYITADYMLILEECQKMLRGLTYIMKVTQAETGAIAIKKTKKHAISVLQEAIKDYPNISLFLLKDVYPAGWERYIVEHFTQRKYNSLPSEVGIVVNNVQTAIAVCDAIEQNKPLIEKVITITGEGIKEPQNFRVKIGTNVKELIEKCGGYTDSLGDTWIIAGGPMTGRVVMGENLIVSANLSSVIIVPKKVKLNNPHCMGCGKCAEHCPAHLTPTAIKQAYDLNNIDELMKLNVLKCVQCGLCSYVCPSRVEMTETVGKAKDLVIKMKK